MKKIVIPLLILLPLFLIGITREVSLSGTYQYTSIQAAIDASVNGDIVQVHPGEYFEHLNANGKSITIQSMFPTTLSEDTINNTIIHSDVIHSCLEVKLQESVTINGFTMMNNNPANLGVNLYGTGVYGGGIEVSNHSSIQISNCIIKDCLGNASGGVYFCGLNFFMSNTKIFNCYGVEGAGGITIERDVETFIVFDSIHLNSIYDNTGRFMDVFLNTGYFAVNIPLYTFSISLTEPDDFYFYGALGWVTISVQNAYFNLVNHDLYLSPTGSNANSGLTPNSPLQTIAYAAKIIESDSLNPKTIHLAPGIYNFSEANQYYPFGLKAHTRLIGEDMESTIFDSEQSLRRYISIGSKDVKIESITFNPTDRKAQLIGAGNCDNIVLKDLRFDGNCDQVRIGLSNVTNSLIENIIINNSVVSMSNIAFRMFYCSNVVFNNILIDNLDITNWMSNSIGFDIWESDVTIRNSIISNCEGYDVSVFSYQNIESAQSNNSLDMSNMLIYNNQSTGSLAWSIAPVYMNNRYQRMKMNNCTIANNNGYHNRAVFVKGDCDISNSIFYNPVNIKEIGFSNVYDAYDADDNLIHYTHHPSINYSLLSHPYSTNNDSLMSINNVMMNANPLFAGSLSEYPDSTLSAYYTLSEDSPCINAGTPDVAGLNLPIMDMAGNYRIWDNRIDMGCFEYGSEPVGNDDPVCPLQPDRIALSTYPNPVYLNDRKGGYTFIEFTLPEKTQEQPVVDVYNLKGQKVRTMKVSESFLSIQRKANTNNYALGQKGEAFSIVWDCRDDHYQKLASGIYIIKVSSGLHRATSKLTIMK